MALPSSVVTKRFVLSVDSIPADWSQPRRRSICAFVDHPHPYFPLAMSSIALVLVGLFASSSISPMKRYTRGAAPRRESDPHCPSSDRRPQMAGLHHHPRPRSRPSSQRLREGCCGCRRLRTELEPDQEVRRSWAALRRSSRAEPSASPDMHRNHRASDERSWIAAPTQTPTGAMALAQCRQRGGGSGK